MGGQKPDLHALFTRVTLSLSLALSRLLALSLSRARARALPLPHSRSCTYIHSAPIMGGHKLDLHALFTKVLENEGFEKVQESKKWRELALQLGVPRTCTSATAQLRYAHTHKIKSNETCICQKRRI